MKQLDDRRSKTGSRIPWTAIGGGVLLGVVLMRAAYVQSTLGNSQSVVLVVGQGLLLALALIVTVALLRRVIRSPGDRSAGSAIARIWISTAMIAVLIIVGAVACAYAAAYVV